MKKEPNIITIRPAVLTDLPRIMEIEYDAFPPEEAAEPSTYQFRLENLGEWFFAAEVEGKVTGCINGRTTARDSIDDSLYERKMQEGGAYFALLSVETDSAYRGQGVGTALIQTVIEKANAAGLEGIILACKEEKISYYEQFGFVLKGKSHSDHGGAVWYDMILKLKQVL